MKDVTFILTFHSDPGHGWLELPALLVDKLNILDRISEYSYFSFDSKKYFLEEDCDAPIAIETMKQLGITFAIREQIHAGDSFVRRLPAVGAV